MKILIRRLLFFTLFLSFQANAEPESCLIDKGILQTNTPKAEYVIQCEGFLVLSFESTHLDPNFTEIQNFMTAFGYGKFNILSLNIETGSAKILAEK